MMDGINSTGGAAPPRLLSRVEQALVSCFWLANSVHWGALLAVVLPSQVASIVGDGRKELYNGLVAALGAVVSLGVTPIAGALSDRSRSRLGRRRPFMLVGTAVNIAFLAAMAGFGAGDNIGLFLVCYMGVQLGSNWALGPYAGLIPDVVPPSQRGSASGFMALMTAVGTIFGAVAAGALARGQRYEGIYGLIIMTLVGALALTCAGVHEEPNVKADAPLRQDSLLPRFSAHRDFYWVLITRGFITMGVFSVLNFLQFFLSDIVGVKRPEQEAALVIAVIMLAGLPASLVAGELSDRWGRKLLIYASGGLMALSAAVYSATVLSPSLPLTLALAAAFGVGFGAYQAVDWALATDVLPSSEHAAKHMGIWHIALVLPQVLAPGLSGVMLNALKGKSLPLGYAAAFMGAAVWFTLGTVLVRNVRGVR